MKKLPILSSPAALWNGKKQLPGILHLTSTTLFFTTDDFRHSHLTLEIPLDAIREVESFLLFDLTRHGLKVTGKDEYFDLFVLDDPVAFKQAITSQCGKKAMES